jgi:hypothetical protein
VAGAELEAVARTLANAVSAALPPAAVLQALLAAAAAAAAAAPGDGGGSAAAGGGGGGACEADVAMQLIVCGAMELAAHLKRAPA